MHARLADTQRLAAIRADLAALETQGWTRVEDSAGGFVEATAEFGERIVLLRFDALASDTEKQFIADAADNMRFMLSLVDRAINRMRAPPSAQPPAGPIHDDRKNYAAEAAMKCGEGRFQTFLAERHGLEPPLDEKRTAQKLRSLLGIASRRDLNDDDAAAARWKKLRGDYEAWRRAER